MLDVVAGRILYRTTGTLGNAVYSLPTSADFAAPPTPVTLLSGNLLYPILWSTTRFFYQEGNIANVMRLDGTGSETYEGVDLSYWIGCTGGRSADIPAHPENSERCRRVYLADTNAGTGGAVHSYDAEADPAGAFFASTSRAHVAHGALPDEYFMAAMIVDTERATTVHSTSPYDVVAAKLEIKPTIGDAFRTALFSIVDTGAGGGPLSMFAQPTSSVVWLSRDP